MDVDFKALFIARRSEIEAQDAKEREERRLLDLAAGDQRKAQALKQATAWLLKVDLAAELLRSEHHRVVVWDADSRYREPLIGVAVSSYYVSEIIELFRSVRPDLDCEPAGWMPTSVMPWEYGFGSADPCVLYFRPGVSNRGTVTFENPRLKSRIKALQRVETQEAASSQS
jgi:hypothetical protein